MWPTAVAVPMWQYRSEGDSMNFDRITVEPEKLEGEPSVRGLRITVETVVRRRWSMRPLPPTCMSTASESRREIPG